MKVKDFIKALQEADTTNGEARIQLEGGAIHFCEQEPGYYDGCHYYLEDGNFVISSEGTKIAVYTYDLEDWVSEQEGNENKVKFKLSGFCSDTRKDMIKRYKERIDKVAKERDLIEKRLLEGDVFDLLYKLKDGWRVIQPLDTKIGHYNKMWFIKKDPKEIKWKTKKGWRNENKNFVIMKQGECGAILKSGLFKHIKKERYYEWILDLKQQKDDDIKDNK